MELETGSLDAKIAPGPLSPDLVRSILRQVLTALASLHQLNKIHGAVRPDNVRVDAEGNARLGEPAATPTKRGPAGPAKYLAPELLRPEFGAVGPGVDLYCLGFMALEMLKGPPFDALFPGVGPNDIDVEIAWLRWHSSAAEALPPPTELIAGLPQDLGIVLDRLLKKNVQDRYLSAQAALRDLDEESSLTDYTIGKKEAGNRPVAKAASSPRSNARWQPAPRAQVLPRMPSGRGGWFGKKSVLVLLLALVLVPALLFHFWPPVSDKIAVTIASVPSQARVFIDNQLLKKSTNSRFELPPGEYTLRLELDDYQPFEGKIGVNEQRRVHKVTLNKSARVPTGRRVRIASVPTGASVYINDVLKGKTAEDVRVPVEPFALKLSAPGYKSVEMKITSLDQLKEALVLERQRRTIELATDPPGADVYIDDKLQEKKTNGSFEVNDGSFTLRLAYKGLPSVTRKIDDPSTLSKPIVFERMVRLIADPPAAIFFIDGAELKGKSSPAEVALQPGRHKIKAVMAGYAAEEKTIDVVELFQEERLALQALAVHRHALLIGVRQAKEDLPSFVHAESDMETLGRALQVGGFKADKIAILTQTRGSINPDDLPTAANIRERLKTLVANTTSADIIVVSLVGHAVDFPGLTYFVPDGAKQANPDTLLSLGDVLDSLRKAPALKKLLVLDCWRKDWTNKDATAHARAWDDKPPPGVTILYGCGVGQTGYEHPRSWHGAFNLALIQGLMGEETGPQITARALGEFCRRQVANLVSHAYPGALQVPVVAAGNDNTAWTLTTPGEATADYLLGCSLLEQANKTAPALRENQLDKALEAFNRAEPNLLSFPELYLRRADVHYNKQQFEAALADFGTALNLDSTSAAAYAYLGEVQRAAAKKARKTAAKDYAEALKNLNKAIELEPECALAYDARGTIYYSYNAFPAAVKDYAEATRLQPRFGLPWGNLGLTQAALQKWDDAIAAFDKAIALDNKHAPLFVERGTAWSMKGNAERAVEDFSSAIKLSAKSPSWNPKPKYKEACYYLGTAYFREKMYSRAAEALTKAVTLDANYAEAHRLLVSVYQALNDEKKAQTHKKLADKLGG